MVSFVGNPLVIHIKGDREDLLSVLFAVSKEGMALVLSEGLLGWVALERFTVESDMVSFDQPEKEPDGQ